MGIRYWVNQKDPKEKVEKRSEEKEVTTGTNTPTLCVGAVLVPASRGAVTAAL